MHSNLIRTYMMPTSDWGPIITGNPPRRSFINWLPFVGDRKDDGVEELQLAVDSSLFSNDLALNSLIWIHLERKDPQSALACAETLHSKYPQRSSRLVKWGMAFSNYAAGKFAAALESILAKSLARWSRIARRTTSI